MPERFGSASDSPEQANPAVVAGAATRFGGTADTPEGGETDFAQQLKDLGSHTWDMLAATPGALYGSVRHPVDTISAMMHGTADQLKAYKEAVDRGDYHEALERMTAALPIVGPLLDKASSEIREGKVGAAGGDLLGSYLGAKIVGKLPEVAGAALENAPRIAAAAKAGVKGGLEMKNRFGIPIPASVAGAATGGFAARELGLPEHVGAVVGAAAPVVRGAVKGWRASAPIEAVQEAAATAVPPPVDPLLNDIAKGYGYKDFASAGEDQARIQDLATKIGKTTPAAQSSAPAAESKGPQSVERIDTGPKTAPGHTIQEQLQQYLEAQRTQPAADVPRGTPAEGPGTSPDAMTPEESAQLDEKLRQLNREWSIKRGENPDKPLGEFKYGRYLNRFETGSGDAPIIDSSKRKPYSTAPVANPSMLKSAVGDLVDNPPNFLKSNPKALKLAQQLRDAIAK